MVISVLRGEHELIELLLNDENYLMVFGILECNNSINISFNINIID